MQLFLPAVDRVLATNVLVPCLLMSNIPSDLVKAEIGENAIPFFPVLFNPEVDPEEESVSREKQRQKAFFPFQVL